MEVKLHVYDLSRGMARMLSASLLGKDQPPPTLSKQFDGIWHTGVVVFGLEYFFGNHGIECCQPGGLQILGPPDKVVKLGTTALPKEIFDDYLNGLSLTSFRGGRYHLMNHNCNTFSNEVSQFLTGTPIPSYVSDMCKEIATTPMGQSLLQLLERINEGGVPVNPDDPLREEVSRRRKEQNEEDDALVIEATRIAQELDLRDKEREKQRLAEDDDDEATASSTATPAATAAAGKTPNTVATAEQRKSITFPVKDFTKAYNDLQNKLSGVFGPENGEVFTFIDDIHSFLTTSKDDNLGVSRSHMQLLGELLLNNDDVKPAARLDLLVLLQGLMLSQSFVSILRFSTEQPLLTYAERLLRRLAEDESDIVELKALIKALANSCACNTGYVWLLSNDRVVDKTEVTPRQLLLDLCSMTLRSLPLANVSAVLVHNLTLSNIEDEDYANDLLMIICDTLTMPDFPAKTAQMTAENVSLSVVELLLYGLLHIADYGPDARVIANCEGAIAALKWDALTKCCPDKALVTRTKQALDQLVASLVKKTPVSKTLSAGKKPVTPDALD